MQTWLTRTSFLETAADLEDDLLLQQIAEAEGLVMELTWGMTELDVPVPLRRMWTGFEPAAAAYACALAVEANERGFQEHTHLRMASEVTEMRRQEKRQGVDTQFALPPWIGDTAVMKSHRSNLIRRAPQYARKWPNTPERMPYVWPFLNEDGTGYKLMISKYDKGLMAAAERKLPRDVAKRIENL